MRGSKTSASYRAIYTRSFSPSRNPPSSEGTREEAESSQAFYFAHGFLGQYIPHSLSEICADDAEAIFLGLNPGSSTFRDKTPTFTWQKGKFVSFYRNYCVFCVLDGYSHLMILL